MSDATLSIPDDGPHRGIETTNARDRFALDLFDVLWDRYRARVSFVRDYERIILEAGGTFVNDHIAFRTLAGQQPLTGISGLSRIFEALGYRPAGCYSFEDKHLGAIHYQHPHPEFPKLFISELKTWELSESTCSTLGRVIASHRPPIAVDTLRHLAGVDSLSGDQRAELMAEVVAQFHERPWNAPEKSDVEAVAADCQYAAWVMMHGYNVNHFTSLVNSHGVDALNDIDKTMAALQNAGVPTKGEIEGEPGSKLRQSATGAVTIDVEIADGGNRATIPWTYAYFELAERNAVVDPGTGQSVRFEGFLGPQATQLFEMTRVQS